MSNYVEFISHQVEIISHYVKIKSHYDEILQLCTFDVSMPLTVCIQRTDLQLCVHGYNCVDMTTIMWTYL